MNLIYILGTGSKWDDNELKYSLRSVEKYLSGFEKVILVGERPDWIVNVEHYYAPDFRHVKAGNVLMKIKAACSVPNNDHFILMNDDFYFTAPTKASEIPLYFDKKLSDLEDKYKIGDVYGGTITRTKKYLMDYGYSTLNFEVHYPFPVQSMLMAHLLNIDDFSGGYQARSLYGNMVTGGSKPFDFYNTKPMFKIDLKKDLKLTHQNKAESLHLINNTDMFSISDQWLEKEGKEMLQELFPVKSKYEI